MTLLCLIPGPDRVMKVAADSTFMRWCYLCRRRRLFYWVLMGDSQPSYYDPTWLFTCAACGRDGSRFPGTY